MTRATFTGLLGGVLAVVALAWPARAEQPTPRAYAVLIGISQYDDKNIQPRPHAEADVTALYELLTSPGHLGLEKDNVRLLLGKPAGAHAAVAKAATRTNVLDAVKWVSEKARRDDLVILAYVGQGAAFGERADRMGYFAVDSSTKDVAKSIIPAAALAEHLDKLKSHKVCSLVDVYLKGYTLPDNKPALDPNISNSFYKEFLGDDGSDEGVPAVGRILYLASNGRVASPDAEKHGSFMQTVLDALKGKADREGYEPDGTVTVDELTDYLNKELPDLVRKHAGTSKERLRHLVLFGEDAHFSLVSNPAVAPKVKERLAKFEELAKQNPKLTPEIVTQGKDFLSRMPRLEAYRNLRKDYQKLTDGQLTVEKFLESRANILESTKLRRAQAQEFAEKVMDAIKTVSRDYVKEVNRGEMVAHAIRGLYKKAGETIPEAIQNDLAKVKEMKEKELLRLLTDARTHLGKREDLDKHKDIDNALFRMLNHLDPYTTYYDPESLEREKSSIQGRFIGVGIQITKDPATDYLKVVTPIYGSPAFKAGIQAGDLVTTITLPVDKEGKPLDEPKVLSTKGMDVSDAVRNILGRPKTPVKLTIQRPGEETTREFNLVRNEVSVETVLGAKRKDDATWDYIVDPTNKIGYVRLTQFTRNSYPDMFKVMANLKKEGVKGLVLDLRFNPGGLLDSARDISDLFIDDGTIVSIRPRGAPEYVMRGFKEGSHLDFPMVCLVNGLSASGSEIVSACLQDHHRAVIMGERSYGKGSVQNVVDFEREGREVKSQIKLTTATFWRPSGKNLNKSSTKGTPQEDWGVRPDKEVPLTRAERDELYEHQRNLEIIKAKDRPPSTEDKVEFKDKQLDAALEYLRSQIKLAQLAPARKAG